MIRSSKHGKRSIDLDLGRLDGGLNLAMPPHAILDNQLTEALNVYYDTVTGKLITRPGAVRESTVALPDIPRSYMNITVDGVRYRFIATTTQLFYMVDTVPTLVGNFVNPDDNAVPKMASFKNKVFVAHGGALHSWDGPTLGNWVTDVTPFNCTVVKPAGARLYVNRTDEPDSMIGCAVLDETDWDYGTGNAVFFQAGWSDGDVIVAAEALGNDLVIAKGPYNRSLFYASPTTNQGKEIARGTGIMGPQAMTRTHRNVLLFDRDGINTVAGVEQYGDLRVDPMSNPVQGSMTRQVNDTAFMVTWPDRAVALCFPDNTSSFCYVLHYNLTPDIPQFRWTRFTFNVPGVMAGEYDQYTNKVWLVSRDRYLYSMSIPEVGVVYQDNGLDYSQRIHTKVFDAAGSKILFKGAWCSYEPLSDGTIKLLYIYDDGTVPVELTSGTVTKSVIDDFTDMVIDDFVAPPVGSADVARELRTHARKRNTNFKLAIELDSGAVAISRLAARAAVVGRE